MNQDLAHKNSDNVIRFPMQSNRQRQLLQRLFEDHEQPLRAFLIGRVRVAADIEDIIQDVFTRLAKMPDLHCKLKTSAGDARPYLMTIAHNLVVDSERRRATQIKYLKESHLAEDSHQTCELGPETVTVDQQRLSVLESAIVRLPTNWRTAFALNRFKNMSYKDIAANMGVSSRTVENYIAKALDRLKYSVDTASGGKS